MKCYIILGDLCSVYHRCVNFRAPSSCSARAFHYQEIFVFHAGCSGIKPLFTFIYAYYFQSRSFTSKICRMFLEFLGLLLSRLSDFSFYRYLRIFSQKLLNISVKILLTNLTLHFIVLINRTASNKFQNEI